MPTAMRPGGWDYVLGPIEARAQHGPLRPSRDLLRPCACAGPLQSRRRRQDRPLPPARQRRRAAPAPAALARGGRRRRPAARRRRRPLPTRSTTRRASILRFLRVAYDCRHARRGRSSRPACRRRSPLRLYGRALRCASACSPGEVDRRLPPRRAAASSAAWPSSGASTRDGDARPAAAHEGAAASRDGDEPAPIVGFEVEQMILPRLSGPHVPRFVARRRLLGAALHRDGAARRASR